MDRIRIHFCGGCRPWFDRREFLTGLIRRLGSRKDRALEVVGPDQSADLSLVICGCPTCCEDRDEHHRNAGRCHVIGPDLFDYRRESLSGIPDRIWLEMSQHSEV